MKLDISIEMEKGNLNSTSFSYKDYNEYGFRFNEQDYILAVKDEDFPDKNIILILHRKGQMIEDIDEYDMGSKVFIVRDRNSPDILSLGERFYVNQFTTVQRNFPIGSVDLNRHHSLDVLV